MPDGDLYEGSLAFRILETTEAECRAEMPISAGCLNPFGTVHAGALVWFADVTATRLALGGAEVTQGMESFPVAVTLNAQLLGNRQEGTLTATATWVKKGRRISTVRTLVTAEDGKTLLDLTSTHVSAR